MDEDLTKSTLPVIISMGYGEITSLTGRVASIAHTKAERRVFMRVYVEKREDGLANILIVPRRGTQQHVVHLHGVSREEIREQLPAKLDAVRGRPLRDAPGEV